MKNKFHTSLLSIAAMAMTVGAANAAATIYEPFSQAAGDLNGKAGGTGLSGNWATNNTGLDIVSPTTLDYGDLDNTGGQVNMPNNAGIWASVSTSTALSTADLLDDGATLWFSYVFQKTSNGGSNEQSGFAFGTERVNPAFNGLNLSTAGDAFGVFTNSSSVIASSWANSTGRTGGTGTANLQALGTATLVIGKIVWNANSSLADTLTVYTRALDDIATEPNSGGSTRSAILNQTAFDTISFGQRNSGGTQFYDEIRFGATFADVSPIPEPSAALLGGLGMVVLLRRRR